MQPKHIIFDLDGTLLHFPHDFFLSRAQAVFGSLGFSGLSLKTLREAFSRYEFFSVCDVANQHLISEQFWELFKGAAPPKPIVFDGVHELLATIFERGMAVSIATARDMQEAVLKKELEELGLLNFVSGLACRTDRSLSWMDKRTLITALCASQGFNPAESLMVGDTPSDIDSAKAVGIGWTVAVLSGGIYAEVLARSKPDHLISDVSKLLSLLKR